MRTSRVSVFEEAIKRVAEVLEKAVKAAPERVDGSPVRPVLEALEAWVTAESPERLAEELATTGSDNSVCFRTWCSDEYVFHGELETDTGSGDVRVAVVTPVDSNEPLDLESIEAVVETGEDETIRCVVTRSGVMCYRCSPTGWPCRETWVYKA